VVELVVEAGMLYEESFALDQKPLALFLLFFFFEFLFLLNDIVGIIHVGCKGVTWLDIYLINRAFLIDKAVPVEVVLIGFRLVLTLLVELKVAFLGVEGRRHLIYGAQILRVRECGLQLVFWLFILSLINFIIGAFFSVSLAKLNLISFIFKALSVE